MKLQCKVEVINRMHNNLNIRSNTKYLKSTLALGKVEKKELEYFIIHFSTVNKMGTKYLVKRIKQVFVKCLNEGKCTIRFEDPPHDLCIQSESKSLKCFMKLLKSCITGEATDVQLTHLSNISVVSKDNMPTKMVVHDRSEFPEKGLPRSLNSLYIVGLKLCNFRRDILSLKDLSVLDLSNNEIEKLPKELGRMQCLRELYLVNNQLGISRNTDWRWLSGPQITKSLKLLDLSGNKLLYLPTSIWKLQNLVTLKLDNNLIKNLPASLGRIDSLRYLTFSKNNLESLPCSILHCNLEYIDISSNNFLQKNGLQQQKLNQWKFCVVSLVHLASNVVLKHTLFYDPSIIPWTLVETLDNANLCVCGSPVVNNDFSVNIEFELKDYFRTVVFDNNKNSTVDFECYFCSSKCLHKIFRNRKLNI